MSALLSASQPPAPRESLLSARESARFEALANQHYPSVLRYACRLTGCRDSAEDLTQEAFVRAYRKFGTYDPSRPFANWLARITHNQFVDGLRGRRQPSTVPLEFSDGEGGAGSFSLDLPDSAHDPQNVVMTATLDERLEQALRALPPDFRSVILLCDVHGLSYEEIAARLDCSIGTVRSRIHRGRKTMRKFLANTGAEAWRLLPQEARAAS